MKFVKIFGLVLLSVAICVGTWGGLGAWLRSQPSTILYLLGTFINCCVPVVLFFIGKKGVSLLDK